MRSIACLAAVLMLLCWSLPASADAKDEDKILGTWKMESGQRGGEDAPPEIKDNFRMIFAKDGKVTMKISEDRTREGTFKLDATKKPKEISITLENMTKVAIYELDGDTLKICVNEDDKGAQPTRFESPKETEIILMVLKREKK